MLPASNRIEHQVVSVRALSQIQPRFVRHHIIDGRTERFAPVQTRKIMIPNRPATVRSVGSGTSDPGRGTALTVSSKWLPVKWLDPFMKPWEKNGANCLTTKAGEGILAAELADPFKGSGY